jgi:hypothetical protein
MKLNFKEDDELVLFCAFRYALGRRTYVVSAIVEIILENWEKFSPERQEQFKKEILEHKKLCGDLGDACDEDSWNRILQKD